jgi:fermentation-respiration switch protein FrsA (DUF1100 family)
VLAAGVVAASLVALLAAPSLGLSRAAARRAAAKAASTVPVTGATDGGLLPVATTTVTLVDDSRGTAARGDTPASDSRTLNVTITYPDTASADQYPLVVFVHGFDVDAATYAGLETDLAARGFVVAAPDFPLSSSALGGGAVRDIVDQATDVSLVITSLLDPAGRPAAIRGLVAETAVAVVGHSDGAVTAAGVAFADGYADARVGAAVVLSGAEAFFPGGWFGHADPPALLAIHGTADDVNPFGASTTLYDAATGAKALVAVDGGGHLAPFTTDDVRAVIATAIADFLRAHLPGDGGAAGRFATDAAAAGLELVASS